jgi:UDP-N-acetylglucosamine acyltransferase
MIHSSAVIHPKAQIGAGCEIGPYCVIGENVTLGENCRLHSHVVIEGHTTLGKANEIFPFATIGKKTQDLKWQGGVTHLTIGDRNVFREGVTVHRATTDGHATKIGSDNLFLTYVHIAHDCQLGDHIIMSGYAGLAGHVVVEDHAILGGYTAVHQFCRVGKFSMTGGCSRIPQDVAPFMIVEGNPAETRTINKIGLERNGFSEEAQAALRSAYKIIFREELSTPNALLKIEKELPALPEVQHLIQFVRASERGITK